MPPRDRHFDPNDLTATPEGVVLHRRKWLKAAGLGLGTVALAGVGYKGWRFWRGSDTEVILRGKPRAGERTNHPKEVVLPGYPPKRDERFAYDRTETKESDAARHTNFYEFSQFKHVWRLVDDFHPYPWTLTVDGLCANPLTLDLDALHTRFAKHLAERQYRHRCVETWAMAVPWSGIPLAEVLRAAQPLAEATHVRFVSFNRPEEAPGIVARDDYPWPYNEGLTLAEATNDLTFLATGMYGHALLKQHGAPIRLVVPWKYGFKSAKSIERIELVNEEPATFWSTLNPEAYPFEANVEPDVPRPWPQQFETMLGTGEEIQTQLYNGYGEYVAALYG